MSDLAERLAREAADRYALVEYSDATHGGTRETCPQCFKVERVVADAIREAVRASAKVVERDADAFINAPYSSSVRGALLSARDSILAQIGE